MELVCPLCNGLTKYLCRCHKCESVMIDKGPITDFLDEYSPYLPIGLTSMVDGANSNFCVHLFYCEKCDHDKRVKIERIKI
ncbi:MAG: hypothetical protein N4A57_17690 [Anaeromicrobium sp.]|uniref:hypothetical protein n=1 Tax=Anaeromicrobium sp. TaxID=1929132 RepID=UPI0025E33CD5|nr:hypothetical protein [Anaeromicrobium sp.]MCT4596084.1 hypothetical protein [Anaeromicrobium sp.]